MKLEDSFYKKGDGVCVIIPVYNNVRTIREIAERSLAYCSDVFVIDDGSDDGTSDQLEGLDVHLIRYSPNRGKGYALKTGFAAASKLGFRFAITIDGDLQHSPEDIPAFMEMHRKYPSAMLVGSRNLNADGMPARNTFANKFSNFWFRLQTGVNLPDTQSGFRMYPLQRLGKLRFLTYRYEAELEMLVFQCWKGTQMIPVPINVYYPPEGKRVTHFRPFADFARISLLNTFLCILALIYGLPAKIIRGIRGGN